MLNLHSFPLVPYPGLAPELVARSGMGHWQPYELAAPADRLLPFVLARPIVGGGPAWVNCAWIEHADTGARIATLLPTGQTSTAPPPMALVLQKLTSGATEYFVYAGARIPTLALPCGVPLRLVVDNACQSPRFQAHPNLSGFLRLDWWHDGPLSGLPYGTGLRQRFYVDNAALSFAAPRKEQDVTKDAATGAERIDFLALWRTATLETEPVPAYLCEALNGTVAHKYLEVDGEPWRARDAKEKTVGDEGGRASLSLTLEQQQVVIRRAGTEPALTTTAYNPATDTPRPWRCGDTSDTAPDFQPTGGFTCETDDNGNTGFLIEETRDANPNSATYGATSTRTRRDVRACPLPVLYYSRRPSVSAVAKDDCPSGYVGSTETLVVPMGDARFVSYLSEADAEARADAFVAANVQAYANRVGTCSVTGAGGVVQWGPVYTPEGCFACQMVNINDAADVRDCTHAEALQFQVAGYLDANNDYVPCVIC